MSDEDPFEDEIHFSELPRDDPHYALVGRIASAWSRFEFLVDQMIWSLAAMDDEHGACVTAQIFGASPRLKALCALVGLQKGITPEVMKDLKRFANDTQGLTDQRNRIVHDSWMMGRKTKKVAQIRAIIYLSKANG